MPSALGAQKAAGQRNGNIDLRKAPNKALGWIMPLHRKARDTYWVQGNQDQKMAYIACTLAFHFSLRIGEMCSTGPYNKHPRFHRDHRFYGWDLILESGGETSQQYTIRRYRECFPKPSIEVVVFIKNSSKTSGRVYPDGKPYYLTRASPDEAILLDDFLSWLHDANHDLTDHPIA